VDKTPEQIAADLLAQVQGRVHQDTVYTRARQAMMRDMTGGFYDEHLFRATMRATVEAVAAILQQENTNAD
jgi:hypothetical protein